MSGGPPVNPVTVRLCELLDDRDWHELDRIMREAGKIVPPGQAVRRAEKRRDGGRNAPSERRRELSAERLVQIGQRIYVRDALGSASRYIERKTDSDGVSWVRLREVPPRVHEERSRARARREFEPADLADELRDGADASALLRELSHRQLLLVARELAARERARAQS